MGHIPIEYTVLNRVYKLAISKELDASIIHNIDIAVNEHLGSIINIYIYIYIYIFLLNWMLAQ